LRGHHGSQRFVLQMQQLRLDVGLQLIEMTKEVRCGQ
jgi:hypothetical protein